MFILGKFREIGLIIFCSLFFLQYSFKKIDNVKKITVASSGKIDSVDPARANTLKSYQLISALGDTLYEINNQGNLIPKLASAMPIVSSDKLKVKIKLKKGINFHDGTSFDASAMKFTIERFQNLGTANYLLDNKIKSIEAPQKHLLVINLKEPFSKLEGLLTSINLTAVSPSFYKNHFNKFLNDKFVGTGKYKLQSFSNEIQILSPNINHWEGKPRNNGINFIGYNSSSSLYGAFRSNQIDVLLSNSIDDTIRFKLYQLSKEEKIKEGKSKPSEISFVSFKTINKPLDNKQIRIALSKTLNRELVSKKVSYGLRSPAKSIIPLIYTQKVSNSWQNYDPIEAKKILRKFGYCDGNILKLPLTYRSNVPSDKLIAIIWQKDVHDSMRDCLSIKINGVESTTIYKNLGKGLYSAVILDWKGGYSDPEAYLSPLLKCNSFIEEKCIEGESVFSGSFWASNKVERLFNESDNLIGEKRLNKLLLIEKIASESAPYIPIWVSSQKAWSQNNISTPLFSGAGFILMSQLEVINE